MEGGRCEFGGFAFGAPVCSAPLSPALAIHPTNQPTLPNWGNQPTSRPDFGNQSNLRGQIAGWLVVDHPDSTRQVLSFVVFWAVNRVSLFSFTSISFPRKMSAYLLARLRASFPTTKRPASDVKGHTLRLRTVFSKAYEMHTKFNGIARVVVLV